MGNWIDKALELLQRSLMPVVQELNKTDWKSGLSDNNERLAASNVSMTTKIIFETIDAGFMKTIRPEKFFEEVRILRTILGVFLISLENHIQT
jgi:hypothetical protein